MALVFEQQPKESAKAFAAFSVYLSMGPERSLEAVGRKLGKSQTLMERWSRKYDWPARVQAHAVHMAIVERESQEAFVRAKSAEWGKRQQEIKEEEWAVHTECLEAGREGLKRFYEKGRGATLGDIARLLELASKLGRLATGLGTDRTEVTGEDGGPIRIEFEVALRKIYGATAEVISMEENREIRQIRGEITEGNGENGGGNGKNGSDGKNGNNGK